MNLSLVLCFSTWPDVDQTWIIRFHVVDTPCKHFQCGLVWCIFLWSLFRHLFISVHRSQEKRTVSLKPRLYLIRIFFNKMFLVCYWFKLNLTYHILFCIHLTNFCLILKQRGCSKRNSLMSLSTAICIRMNPCFLFFKCFSYGLMWFIVLNLWSGQWIFFLLLSY